MSLGTTNRDGGKTSESGHLRAIYKDLIAEVLNGFNVTQRAAGANMSVDVQIGDAVLPRSDATYGHPVFNDAVLNKTVTTADASNPRRDIVILYLDYGVTPSTAVSNNTNGVVAVKVVAGTAAGSPVDPNAAALQSAAGSGNPYIKLARIRVGAGVTTLSNSVIDDLRSMAHGLSQGDWIYDSLFSWVYASATTFTVAGVDVTAQLHVGTKLALYQSGSIKYFVVTAAAFSTNSTITLNGLGTYTLTNVPIDKPAYSYSETPVGFPPGPAFNPYAFRVYRAAAYTTAATTTTPLPFDTKGYDIGTNVDVATNKGRFTVPAGGAGLYWFAGRFRVNSTNNVALLLLNGAEFSRGNDIPSGAAQIGVLHTDQLKLVAGDYVEFAYFCSAAQAMDVGQSAAWFTGHLVSRVTS